MLFLIVFPPFSAANLKISGVWFRVVLEIPLISVIWEFEYWDISLVLTSVLKFWHFRYTSAIPREVRANCYCNHNRQTRNPDDKESVYCGIVQKLMAPRTQNEGSPHWAVSSAEAANEVKFHRGTPAMNKTKRISHLLKKNALFPFQFSEASPFFNSSHPLLSLLVVI